MDSHDVLSRSDSWELFPAGLKVLVVDDDPLCLKVVEHMLRRCNYQGEPLKPQPVGSLGTCLRRVLNAKASLLNGGASVDASWLRSWGLACAIRSRAFAV